MKLNDFFKRGSFFYFYIFLAVIFVVVVLFSIFHYLSNDLLILEVDQANKTLFKFKADEIQDYRKDDLTLLASRQVDVEEIDQYYDEVLKEYKAYDPVFSQDSSKNTNKNLSNKESESFAYQQWQQEVASLDQHTSVQMIQGLSKSFVVKKSMDVAADSLKESRSQEKQIEIKFPEARQKLKTFYNKKFFRGYNKISSQRKYFSMKEFETSPEPYYSDETVTLDEFKGLDLILSKKKYYRFEIIRANLVAPKKINLDDLRVYVISNGKLIPNVSGEVETKFQYQNGFIFSSLSLGYNPRATAYWVVVRSRSNPDWQGIAKRFDIVHSKLPSAKAGFSVVNMEYVVPLDTAKVIAPDKKDKGYRGIVDWINYIDADALWMLVAQTNGWDSKVNPQNPWTAGGFRNLKLLGPVVKEKGLLLGAYIMSFYTPGDGKRLVQYQPSLGYDLQTDTLYASKHVSLIDDNRIKHIAQAARKFQNDENVDFIGFDFIRTGRADGYEMGNVVIRDMNIPTPKKYEQFSEVEKVKWFARLVKNPNNQSAIKKWRWWRAHKVASIVHNVIKMAKVDKPVWTFTLGWNWGHQHGQDPYMFFDAGVFIDAVMLYEASKEMFRNMMHMWPRYMFPSGNNLMVGNSADVRLLDSTLPHPAVEYVYRSKKGYRRVYGKGLAKGIFMHDISRALWSRHRGLDVSEWALVHGNVTSSYRQELGILPYSGSIVFNKDRSSGTITVKNNGESAIPSVSLRYSATPAWSAVTDDVPKTFSLEPGETKTFSFKATVNSGYKGRENILGYYLDSPFYRRCFFFTYQTNEKQLQKYLHYSR